MKDINKKLEVLYDLLVDNYAAIETELKDIISEPEKIKNTNKFATLLSKLKNSTFINPLILAINGAQKSDIWLLDYLYAVITLLEECSENEEFEIPENLIDKLRVWILGNKGEIAWKSAHLLKFYESETAEKIQLEKLEERGDFFLTYVECILGLLRYKEEKHIDLVKNIAKDDTRDLKLRAFAEDIAKNYPRPQ